MTPNPQPPFEVIVFDWDGTLMDSQGHIVACLDKALRAVDVEPGPPAELARVIGLGLFEALASLLPGADNATVHTACEAFREEFLSAKPGASTLFPDVETTLRGLREMGFHLAVATGKSRRGLDKNLAETGLDELFAVTRCADETASKPHPQMLEEILVDLDTDPRRAIMIGDTAFDLQMAANAGMSALGVSYGVHPVEELRQHQPLAIMDSVREIGEWFGYSGDPEAGGLVSGSRPSPG